MIIASSPDIYGLCKQTKAWADDIELAKIPMQVNTSQEKSKSLKPSLGILRT